MTASCPCDEMRTEKWPGVCPGVDSSHTSSVTRYRSSTSSALPSAMTGRTESSTGSFRKASSAREKKSHSVPPIRYRALGNVATHLPSRSIVFQPTWSTCRCVQTTRSIDSRGQPIFSRSSRNGSRSLFHSGCGRSLSFPTQVSTMMRVRCDSTRNAWMLIRSRPASSQNVG